MNYKSKYFPTVQDLLEEKNRLVSNDLERRERELIVRSFYNGKDLKTRKEEHEEDTPESVNHLIGYRNLLRNSDSIFSIYSSTNSLIEVEVTTGSPEVDIQAGGYIAKYINEAIYHSGQFEVLWSSVAGEECISGKAPLIFNRYGWCPELAPDVLVPEDASAIPGKLPYALRRKKLDTVTLTNLQNAGKSETGKRIDKTAVKALLDTLTEQIKGKGTKYADWRNENQTNPLDDDVLKDTRTFIPGWEHFEVYFHEEKKKYVVSSVLYTDRVNLVSPGGRSEDGEAKVISYVPVAYESPEEWMHLMIVDSQIGGLKTFSTARGLAELTYNSDVDMEELLSEQIAGEKLRARPKFRLMEGYNRAQVAEWNVQRSSVIPQNVEYVPLNGTGNLLTSLQLLSSNTSGLTGGTFSNSGREGGELRAQALARQSENQSMTNNRMSAVYTAADRLVREIVRRFLLQKTKPGTEGYEDIEWVRARLKEHGVNYAELAKMEFGRFKYLKVRIARSVGSGDRESELAVATALMENIAQFEPEVRPLIRRKWVTLMTRDPNLAEQLAKLPALVINAQKVVAENEFDTLKRRSAIGQQLPVGADDIDEDHVPVHMLDFQAFLAESQFRQFNQLDLRTIAGVVDHISAHLSRMADKPASAPDAKVFQMQLQRLVAAAQEIISQVQTAEQEAQSVGLTPKEQADFALKQAALQLDAQKLGLQEATLQANEVQRRQRERRADRGQYAKEQQTAEQQKIAKAQLAQNQQKIENDKQKAKSQAKTGSRSKSN